MHIIVLIKTYRNGVGGSTRVQIFEGSFFKSENPQTGKATPAAGPRASGFNTTSKDDFPTCLNSNVCVNCSSVKSL